MKLEHPEELYRGQSCGHDGAGTAQLLQLENGWWVVETRNASGGYICCQPTPEPTRQSAIDAFMSLVTANKKQEEE